MENRGIWKDFIFISLPTNVVDDRHNDKHKTREGVLLSHEYLISHVSGIHNGPLQT